MISRITIFVIFEQRKQKHLKREIALQNKEKKNKKKKIDVNVVKNITS